MQRYNNFLTVANFSAKRWAR